MGITLSQAGPGGIPFQAGDDAETEMLDGESSITTESVLALRFSRRIVRRLRPSIYLSIAQAPTGFRLDFVGRSAYGEVEFYHTSGSP